MKVLSWLAMAVLLGMSLAACSPRSQPTSVVEPTTTQVVPQTDGAQSVATEAAPATTGPQSSTPVNGPTGSGNEANNAGEGQTREDDQGSVSVEVTPLNLANPGATLDFQVSMNTHSVDLGMDLAGLSTLMTDDNVPIPASSWEGPKGGHHVNGKLSFPLTMDGKSILDGATRVTITLKNVDAPTRLFTWQIPQ